MIFFRSKQLEQQTLKTHTAKFSNLRQKLKEKGGHNLSFLRIVQSSLSSKKTPFWQRTFLKGKNRRRRFLTFAGTREILHRLPHKPSQISIESKVSVTQVLFSGRSHAYQLAQLQFTTLQPLGRMMSLVYRVGTPHQNRFLHSI